MRKTILATAALLSLTLAAGAQTKYGLSVAGHPVTSNNAADVLGDGMVSYDAASKTLTLAPGAHITTAANEGIYNTGSALTILLGGDNEITCSGMGSIIRSHKDLTIRGKVSDMQNRTLRLEGAMQGIYIKEGAQLRIEDCTMQVASTNYGICGDGTEKMQVTYANVTVEETALMTVGDFQSALWTGVKSDNTTGDRNAVNIRCTDQQAPTLPTIPTISATALEYNTIVLNWEKATDNITGASQLLYKLSYRRKTDEAWTAIEPSYNMSTVTLSDLDAEAGYAVRLEVTDRSGNTTAYTEAEFNTDKEPDGIRGIREQKDERTEYDLTGKPVKKSSGRKGIIIAGGKKTL